MTFTLLVDSRPPFAVLQTSIPLYTKHIKKRAGKNTTKYIFLEIKKNKNTFLHGDFKTSIQTTQFFRLKMEIVVF